MKIAIIGYGKMGRAIEQIAFERGHEITFKISSANRDEIHQITAQDADIAIEFTNPESAFHNVNTLISNGIKTISGSTGWTNQLLEIYELSKKMNTSFLWASNFSLGVNLFFELNKRLAELMSAHPYKISINEIHHTHKKDAPSGTAITLANQILEINNSYNNWKLTEDDNLINDNVIPIHAERIDPAPGTHAIKYHSEIDDIEIVHTAHSRSGFALGAVIAAEYVFQQIPGIYSMKDVLDIHPN